MLTKGSVEKIMKGEVVRGKFNLQLLSEAFIIEQLQELKQLTLSDGDWRADFNILGNKIETFQNMVRQYDVINAEIIFNKSKQVGTVINFSLTETSLSSSIGAPRSFEEYTTQRNMQLTRDTAGYNNRQQNESFDEENVTEINNLTPYDNDWKIKARIIKKSELRKFNKKDGGQGCLFNVVLMDDSNDRIQGTFFNETAEQFYNNLYNGKVYIVSGGNIRRVRNPKYNNTGNDLEISFDSHTKFNEVRDGKDIAKFYYNFIDFDEIEKKNDKDKVDVLAIVKDPGVPRSITLRSGEEKLVKDIELIDETGIVCSLTLWGAQANEIAPAGNEIVAFSELQVKEFKGKKFSYGYESRLITDDVSQSKKYLKLLAERNRGITVAKNISEFQPTKRVCKKVSQIESEVQALLHDNYANRETKLYYDINAQVTFIKDTISYPSCPNDNCKKKVIQNFEEKYECARCNQSYDEPFFRYIGTIRLSDDTGSIYATYVGDSGDKIFKQSCKEMMELKERDEMMFRKHLRSLYFSENRVKIKAYSEVYNGESRIKYMIQSFFPLNENNHYANEVEQLLSMLTH
jgi:replication factor A1